MTTVLDISQHHTLLQYRTPRTKRVAAYAISVPHIASLRPSVQRLSTPQSYTFTPAVPLPGISTDFQYRAVHKRPVQNKAGTDLQYWAVQPGCTGEGVPGHGVGRLYMLRVLRSRLVAP
eukprot:2103735-Rhodomonas_salina.2